MAKPRYRRILVKISGEALMGDGAFGLDPKAVKRVAADITATRKLGYEIAVVVGGGNFLRGAKLEQSGLERAAADQMGMLATVINAIALEGAIRVAGADARTLSAVPMSTVCETYVRQRALKHLEDGRVLVLAGGTGNPYFTTDTGAALRAAELSCEAILKATDVDGVYDSDPKRNPDAKRYDKLTHNDALAKDLRVMDAAAFALAREARLPIIVFSIREKGAIAAAARGQGKATTVVP
jgi:uridylate kinase